MGMAAFRVNDEERQTLGAQAVEQAAEDPKPEQEPEAEAPKATTVTAKRSTSKG